LTYDPTEAQLILLHLDFWPNKAISIISLFHNNSSMLCYLEPPPNCPEEAIKKVGIKRSGSGSGWIFKHKGKDKKVSNGKRAVEQLTQALKKHAKPGAILCCLNPVQTVIPLLRLLSMGNLESKFFDVVHAILDLKLALISKDVVKSDTDEDVLRQCHDFVKPGEPFRGRKLCCLDVVKMLNLVVNKASLKPCDEEMKKLLVQCGSKEFWHLLNSGKAALDIKVSAIKVRPGVTSYILLLNLQGDTFNVILLKECLNSTAEEKTIKIDCYLAGGLNQHPPETPYILMQNMETAQSLDVIQPLVMSKKIMKLISFDAKAKPSLKMETGSHIGVLAPLSAVSALSRDFGLACLDNKTRRILMANVQEREANLTLKLKRELDLIVYASFKPLIETLFKLRASQGMKQPEEDAMDILEELPISFACLDEIGEYVGVCPDKASLEESFRCVSSNNTSP